MLDKWRCAWYTCSNNGGRTFNVGYKGQQRHTSSAYQEASDPHGIRTEASIRNPANLGRRWPTITDRQAACQDCCSRTQCREGDGSDGGRRAYQCVLSPLHCACWSASTAASEAGSSSRITSANNSCYTGKAIVLR